MTRRVLSVWVVALLVAPPGLGDEVLYRYDGDAPPHAPSAGWEIFDPCQPPCSESVENGRYVMRWPQAADFVNYHLWIAQDPTPPPPTLWVEWRFRSNHPLGPSFYTCDAALKVRYRGMLELVFMYGDAAFSFSGDDSVTGLGLNQFHTYRFESLDGVNYRISVDGLVFIEDSDNSPGTAHYVQLSGRGGCTSDQIPNMVNEWDYVRYGTIGSGEQIVSVDPLAGPLGPEGYTSFTTFRVTFDAANYVYIDDIAVSVTGGTAPLVTATRRRETDDVDTVEIVLDRALPNNQRTRFTFTDPAGTQHIDYDFREPVPPVPAMGTAGSLLTAGVIVLAGIFVLRRRIQNAE